MSIKLILGVMLPILFIISLIIVENIDMGLSIEIKTIESVEINSLFTTETTQENSILIRNITIKNNYFTPKKIHLPKLLVCLNDNDGRRIRTNFNVMYDEGTSKQRDYYQSYYAQSKDIEVPPHSKKEIKVLIKPQHITDYNKRYQTHYEYDDLLIIEPKDDETYYTYDSCQELGNKDLDKAVKINISPEILIVQSSIQQGTKALRGRNISDCEVLYGSEKDGCYLSIAISVADPSLCEYVKNQEYRVPCYLKTTKENQNYTISPAVKEQFVEYCEQQDSYKDSCFGLTAIQIKDEALCEYINDTSSKHNCYFAVARERKDYLVCEKIESQSSKDTCYLSVAGSIADLSQCEYIKDKVKGKYIKDYCYADVAVSTKNLSICDLIQISGSTNLIDSCYIRVARATEDLSICQRIRSQYYKDMCNREMAQT